MADTIVLPIAGLGILVMDRAEFDAALSAGRSLVPSEAPKPRASARRSDAQLLDAEQLEAVTAVPATWWRAATTLPTQLHDETLLTTEQVAVLTNISRQTFEGWRYRKNGGPKYTKLGPQIIRYRWADVKFWRDSGTVTSGT